MLAALATTFFATAFLVSAAQAQTPVERAVAAKDALSRFNGLADEAARHGDLPHLADPVAGPVLRALWAAGSGVAGDEPDDIAALGEIEAAELVVLNRYKVFSRPPPATPDWNAVAARFPDEYAGAFAASVAAFGNGSRSLEQSGPRFGLSRSDALAGLVRQLRRPGLGLVIDVQHLLDASDLHPEIIAAHPGMIATIARAFADHAQDFALIFPSSDRALFANALQSDVEQLGEPARGQFGIFLAALPQTPCGILCAISAAH